MARSGRQLTPGGGWEEPTQVVSVGGELLEKLTSSQSHPPPAGPTAQQLNFERQLAALATPVPSPAKQRRWLLWAVLLVLLGAGGAAAVEYTLHPARLRMPALH